MGAIANKNTLFVMLVGCATYFKHTEGSVSPILTDLIVVLTTRSGA